MASFCECGSVAATEVQSGWDPAANGGVGGGQYTPLCEACYASTEEAIRHAEDYGHIVEDVFLGLYVRHVVHGHARWTSPSGSFHNDETHERLANWPY